MQNILPRNLWAAVLTFSSTVAVAAYPTIEDQMHEGESPFDWWLLLPLALGFYVPILLIVAFRQRSLRASGYFKRCTRLALSFSFGAAVASVFLVSISLMVWAVPFLVLSLTFRSVFDWSSVGPVLLFAPPVTCAVVACLWGVWHFSDPKENRRASVQSRPSQKKFWDTQRAKADAEPARTAAMTATRYISENTPPSPTSD